VPRVGDAVTYHFPDFASNDACGPTFKTVNGRVAYVGTRIIIVEDLAATLAGQMNEVFTAIGTEFDTKMYPILATNFGDPLVLDDQLDDNDRIVMLATPQVNTQLQGVAGFVIACDLFTPAEIPSSNKAEIFYAYVPTLNTAGYGSNEKLGWLRQIRPTLIHEVKHNTAFSERIARQPGKDTIFIEDRWLEESTARIAEELYSRTIYNSGAKQNLLYRPTIWCDIRAGNVAISQCLETPYVMFGHFDGLYDFLESNGSRTPLGEVASNDFSYYGSGWALTRWIADQYATSEAAFFKALIQQDTAYGTYNLEARAGHSWPEMLGDWSLAMMVDDYPGFTPQRVQLTFPSWNLRDIFAGMNTDIPSTFTKPYPLVPRTFPFGNFNDLVNTIRGGSFIMYELNGGALTRQALELTAPNGAPVSRSIRLAIVRVK
jgi:hypothetical protein